MFAKTADFILKHSKAIVAIWIVLLVCSLPFGLKAGEVLEYDMTTMSGASTESTDGMKIIEEQFSSSIDLSDIVVIEYSDAAELALITDGTNGVLVKFQQLLNTKYGDRVAASSLGSYSKNGDGKGVYLIAIGCNDENLDIIHETGEIRTLVSQAKTEAGCTQSSYVTGNCAIAYDTERSSVQDVSKVDPISIALIFILLALFFFALVPAIIPPAVVGMAYGIALSAVYGIGCMMGVFYITEMLVLVTMLGAGSDYALFILSRYRDERKKGASHDDALRTSIQWAGESVFTSGLAVIIGFGALSLCSFSVVQSMGLVLACGILIALIAALTFIPSVINLLGERMFWPSGIRTYTEIDSGERKGIYASLCKLSKRYFAWLSRFTHKYALPIIIVWALISVPAVYTYVNTQDSSDMISIMPASESVDGLNCIMSQTDGGTIMPTYVVYELNESAVLEMGTIDMGVDQVPFLLWTPAAMSTTVPAMMTMANAIQEKYGIVGQASALNSWAIAYSTVATRTGSTDPNVINHALYSAMPAAVQGYVKTVLDALGYATYSDPDNWSFTPDTALGVSTGGNAVTLSGIFDYILNYGTGIISDNGRYVNMMIITSDKPMSDDTMAFINDLSRDLHGTGGYDTVYSGVYSRSYVSGSSAVMNDIAVDVEDQFAMIRLVVIVLLIVLLFLILGSYLTPIRSMLTIVLSIVWTVALTRFLFASVLSTPVLWLVPIVLFVVLLGLGMDYDIFLTTRIKENKVNGMTNDEAIDDAVTKAGPVTSLCSLIMGGTFLTMLLTSSSMLQEFGFALGAGILIEGLITVSYVVPALMHVMGDWSWKGPRFLRRGV